MATGNTEYVDEMVTCVDEIVNLKVMSRTATPAGPRRTRTTRLRITTTTYNADSILGEAAVFRPIVLMAYQMATNPASKRRTAPKGRATSNWPRRSTPSGCRAAAGGM